MNLAFLIFKYFPHGGVQRDLAGFAAACCKAGHRVTLLAISCDGPVPDGCERLIVIPAKGWTNHARARSFETNVRQIIAREKFDAVVGFNRMAGLDVYFAGDDCLQERWGKLKRLLPRYRNFIAQEASVFGPAGAPVLLTLTDRQEADYQKFYHTDAARFRRLPPGLRDGFRDLTAARTHRPELRKQLGVRDGELLAIQVAASFHTKGVDRTMAILAPGTCRLAVVGADKNIPRFQTLANRLGMASRVVFTGGSDAVENLLCAADFMVHPARDEATGGVLIEALAAHLPVVTTARAGYARFIRDAEAGLVLPEPFELKAWSEAVNTLAGRLAEYRGNAEKYMKNKDFFHRAELAAAAIGKLER